MSVEQKSDKSTLLIILVIVFFGFFGISMPYLIFPALFLNPTYSILPASWSSTSLALLLGVTLAAYPFGQFFGSPILGALSDQYGRKRLLSGSLLIAALANLFTGLALEWRSLGLVITCRFVAGFMEGNISIARAMAAQIKSLPKHETFGKINAIASLAYLLGPLVGGILADNQLFQNLTSATPFYIICMLFFGLAILALTMLKGTNQTLATMDKKSSLWSHFNLIKKLTGLLRNKELKFLLLISTAFTLAIDIFYEFGPVYLTAKWMLTPAKLIIYNAVLCLTGVLGSRWLTTLCSKRYSSNYGIIASLGGLALFMGSSLVTEEPWLMIALFAFCGLVIGLGVTLLTIKISDSAPDAIQGEVMGMQSSLRVLGDALICLLGGVLLLISAKLILLLATIISLLTMGCYILKHKAARL